MGLDEIERGTDTPPYRQIAAELERAVLAGEIEPRHPLPSKSQLQQRYGVADRTAAKALQLVAAHGYARMVRGMGFFVRPRGEWPADA